MRRRIAIDMDETICDTLSRHIQCYNREFNQQLTKAQVPSTKLHQVIPEEYRARVQLYPDLPEFFEDISPFENALEVIAELHNHYDIYIATAAMEHPNSFAPKFRWLRRYLPFLSPLNFIFCGSKNVLNVDYLLDDSARHFEGFAGRGILYSAPHNLAETAEVRLDNWLAVREYFLHPDRLNSVQCK